MNLVDVGSLDRTRYIGGSDSAAILGVSPYQSALDVYLAKTSKVNDEDLWQTNPKQARIFEFGKHNEPLVLQYIEREAGIKATTTGARYKHPDYEFICAEIDAETAEGVNIECKTSNQFMSGNWGRGGDDIPDYYLVQVQHGLMVTGRDKCILGALIGNCDFRMFIIERNQELINLIQKKELEFWQNVQNKTPPNPSNYKDVLTQYAQDNAGAINASDAIVDVINQLKHVQTELKSYTSLEKELKEKISLYMQGNAFLKDGDNILATFKTQITRRLNSTELKKAHPDLYQEFTTQTLSRVLRVK